MLSGKEIRILLLLVIDTIFFFLEVIVGYAVKSLALVADSFHMLNDIISLIIALWAVRVAKAKEADSNYTYGWQRAEILGLLINAVFLLLLCFSIFIEAVQRFISPEQITNPVLILVVGSCGLVSNFVGLFLFHEHGGHSHSHGGDDSESAPHGHSHSNHSHEHSHSHEEQSKVQKNKSYGSNEDITGSDIEDVLPETIVSRYENGESGLVYDPSNYKHRHEEDEPLLPGKKKSLKSLNMQGVFLHVMGDALGNIGVIATALFIWKTDYSWRFYFDPLVSLLITAIIFSSALPLCKASSKILLQATPANLPYDRVKKEILSIPAVLSIHDFHIWNLTEKVFIASLHVEVDGNPEEFLEIAKEIKTVLHEYGVHNATIQPEFIRFYRKKSSASLFKDNANNNANNGSSSHNVAATTNNDADAEGNPACIIDSAVGCNTDNCIS